MGDAVGKAVAATAAIALAIAGVLFCVYHKFVMRRWRRELRGARRETESRTIRGNVKGVLVNENGVDVLYLRKGEGEGRVELIVNTSGTSTFPTVMSNPSFEDREDVKKVVDDSRLGFDLTQVSKVVTHVPPLRTEFRASKTVEPGLPPPPPPPAPTPTPPPPPPLLAKKIPSKPPPAPKPKANKTIEGNGSVVETKLKALHWDKLIANADHSMVWDEMNDGSMTFDDHLIEALFGSSKSPERHATPRASNAARTFILDPRKSQNTSIVLKSLALSRGDILDALADGEGLGTDTLEKLTKISPSNDEITRILNFTGSTTTLADAEGFLYCILSAVPSAFGCFRTMLFKENYISEVVQLKESLRTLELGCNELRARGLFRKLLEAVLKAGNKMNAGTSRGNAQGFDLSALRKLSDVKSTDGKSTLLHFVVEQVAKRSDIDREGLVHGLPALRNLGNELANVRKAAAIEHEGFISACASLSARVEENKRLVIDSGGFASKMRGFLEECEEELKAMRAEQGRVMELARRTTEYYQADKGSHPLHMFVIVKDFLDMVDKVCADISTKSQRNNVVGRTNALPTSRTPMMNFRSHFMVETHSSDSEDDF